jgi:transposase
MPRRLELADSVNNPFEPLSPPLPISTIARSPRTRDMGLIVVLVLLSAASGIAYVLATGQT